MQQNFDIRRVPKEKPQPHKPEKQEIFFDQQIEQQEVAAHETAADFSYKDKLIDDYFAPHSEIEQPKLAATQAALNLKPQTVKPRKSFAFRKVFLVAPLIVLVLFVGAVLGRTINFASSVSLSHQSFYRSVQQDIGAVLGAKFTALRGLDDSAVVDAINNKKRFNILLLGYGGEGHDGPYLTDSMMVVSLDFSTNQISLISLPRDIWVKLPTNGYDGADAKINSAYVTGMDRVHYPNKLPQFSGYNGPGNLAKYAASEVTGMPIDNFVSMDFSGFKGIVDAVGGVNVNVDNAFTDYQYPNGDQNAAGPICVAPEEDYSSFCRYRKVHFDSGYQFMNGDRALEYVRSRHGDGAEGSDFARSRRQQKILASVQDKAMHTDAIFKVFDLMNAIQSHFQTDLSVAEIKDLSAYAGQSSFDNAQRISLSDQNVLVNDRAADGGYILYPKAGLDNWQAVHQYIDEVLNSLNPHANGQKPETKI